MSDAFCAVDKEWRLIYVNRRAEQIIRWKKEVDREADLGCVPRNDRERVITIITT